MIKFYKASDRYTAIDTESRIQGFSAKSEVLAVIELIKDPIPLSSVAILTDTAYIPYKDGTIRHLQPSTISSIPQEADLAYFLEHFPEYFI